MEALERKIESTRKESVHLKSKRSRDSALRDKRDDSDVGTVLPKKPRKKRSVSESSSGSVQISPPDEQMNKSPHYQPTKAKYDIANTFNVFINETLRRLLESEKISLSDCDEIRISLSKHKLDSNDVSADLKKELYRVCKIEYEKVETNSDRLNGFGWSRTKVAYFMKRCLQNKIDSALEIIQSFISS